VPSDIEQLQSRLNHHVRGLVWVSNTGLETYPRPFYALNYFLNGLLLKMEQSGQKGPSKNLYCTKHFDKNFFLGHIKADQDSLDKELLSLMSWVKTQIDDSDKILVLDQSNKQVTKALQKKYPKLNFENFDLN
tara:strand:- start:71181 stop:71579 length:399 start_codon:yes stop_codon:yes gene_type:complete